MLGVYERKTLLPEQPSIQPIEKPDIPQKEELSPEQQLDIKYAVTDKLTKLKEEQTQKQENLRAFAVDYIGVQSKKTQAQIYLSVAFDEEVDLTNDINLYDSLKEIKQQNDAVKGYALYKELQNRSENLFIA